MVFLLVTFKSSHLAMRANKLFSTSEFKCEIIPTPREISSECGFSLMFELVQEDSLKLYFRENNLEYDKIYIKKGDLYEICRW